MDEAIEAVSRVSSTTYQHGLGYGFVNNSTTRILLMEAAKQGWLRMSVLFIGGQASAFQIGLRYHKTYFLAQIGFDPKWNKLNVGTVLLLKVLEDICADPDIEFIDFRFGSAEYKRSYGDMHWPEAMVYISAPRLYPIFINTLRSSMSGLNTGLEYMLIKTGFANRVKRRWRNLLQTNNKN